MTDQTNKDLPPLPKPVKVLYIEGEECPIFGRGQMHAYARAALSASAPTTAPIEALSSECNECGGTGLRDLGGFYPWGAPTMIECDCISKMPTPNAPAAGSVPSDASLLFTLRHIEPHLKDVDAALPTLLSAARAILAQYGSPAWRPIETAPEDDTTRFLGRLKSGRTVTARGFYSVIVGEEKPGGGRETVGSKFGGYAEDCGDAWIPRTFTHWMPLPDEPQEGSDVRSMDH